MIFCTLWFLIRIRFTAVGRLFSFSPFSFFGWRLNCYCLLLYGLQFFRLVIVEMFACFSVWLIVSSQYSTVFFLKFLGCLSLCFREQMRCSPCNMSAGSSVWFVFHCSVRLASSLFFSLENKIYRRRVFLFSELWLLYFSFPKILKVYLDH